MKKHNEEELDWEDRMYKWIDECVLDVVIYVRVSTSGQTTENQIIELAEVCERNKWNIVKVYNETMSGTKGVDERSELSRLMKDASRKKFDKIVVWSVDRLSRSMTHLVNVLSQMKDVGVDIYSYKQGIDTSTTMGSSFFQMVGIFAELENNMRKERQSIGIKRALSQGVKFGRRKVVDEDTELDIVEMRHKGKTLRYIAKKTGISLGSVQKVCSTKSPLKNTLLTV
jgi:DNA invertase Pin-like site-specific DNA recombinase